MIDDPIKGKALLRLYAGEDRKQICDSLGLTLATLEEWERNTPTSELRPPGLASISTVLRLERPGDRADQRLPERP